MKKNDLLVSREVYEKDGKEFNSYKIKGVIREEMLL